MRTERTELAMVYVRGAACGGWAWAAKVAIHVIHANQILESEGTGDEKECVSHVAINKNSERTPFATCHSRTVRTFFTKQK